MDLSLTRVPALNCNHTYQLKHLDIHKTLNLCNVTRKIANLSLSGSFKRSQTTVVWSKPEMEESTVGDGELNNGHILPEKKGGGIGKHVPCIYAKQVGEATASRAAAAAAASAKELECRVNGTGNSSALSAPPGSTAKPPSEGATNISELMSADPIWAAMRAEARLEAEKEPLLSSYLYASILAHSCFERALGFVLANRLQNPTLLATQLMDIFDDVFTNDADIQQTIRLDAQAVKDRDPSCRSYSWALLYLKGYHALQSYRVAHALWNRGQRVLALALQSRISEVFAVDMHPAACIGKGILLDHGTGIVIGETAVIGDRVSMLQGVTLGGTGREVGDRHPKIGSGVLIGAGATILGNITVGNGAYGGCWISGPKGRPPHSMVAGTPAKVIGFLDEQNPSLTMKHDATKGFCKLVAEDSLYGGAGI